MYWLEVSVKTDGEAAEAVAEALRPMAYQDGVVLEQQGDTNSLDPDALETAVTVKIFVSEENDSPALRRRIEEILYHLNRLYPVPPPTFRQLQEQDWAHAWKQHYQPFRVGEKIWIQPSWIVEESARSLATDATGAGDERSDVILRLDPGMAFGTGLHPTTQMCLQVLEQLIRPGLSLLDVGTGSGILAILAARLGATPVLAVDTDAVAVRTARENAAQNDVAAQIAVQQATIADITRTPWDVVVVNILAPVIIEMLESGGLLGYVAQKGRLVLSGIIDQQVEDVQTAVARAGGQIVATRTIRDWVTLIVGHSHLASD